MKNQSGSTRILISNAKIASKVCVLLKNLFSLPVYLIAKIHRIDSRFISHQKTEILFRGLRRSERGNKKEIQVLPRAIAIVH